MNWGRIADTEHPTILYSGDGERTPWRVLPHAVEVPKVQFTVWLERPRAARPFALQEGPGSGQATICMLEPADERRPAEVQHEKGYHGFLFVLTGDLIEERHTRHPMGFVRAVPRRLQYQDTDAWTFAVFYLGVSDTLPPDNDLSKRPQG